MSKTKIVLASLIWLVLLGLGVGLYRLWYVPKAAETAEQETQLTIDQTGSDSFYQHRLNLGLDAFSGYAILRSPQFQEELRQRRIKLEVVDDRADYEQRLESLRSGKLQLAAFPIDALLKANARLGGKPPATIVAVIDETQGADAIVAYKERFPDKRSLLAPGTRFVAVANSPSETLVRLLLNTFGQSLSGNSLALVDSEEQLDQHYRQAAPTGDEVFVTWEPRVSQMLENDLLHKLYDSSEQSGVIVDTLVVSRDYLLKNRQVVEDVLASYFAARYYFGNDMAKLKQLVQEDARLSGSLLSEPQASSLVKGIVWKNTQENFAHFGLRPASVTLLEDMIDRIQHILVQTGGLAADRILAEPSDLFYQGGLSQLLADNFHPGESEESVREDIALQNLSETQWQQLVPVGTVDVPPLVYARGTAMLTEPSKVKLDDLLETLKTFPRYYLVIRGNASSVGEAEANRVLAKQRADAALQYLLEKGVDPARLKAIEGEITGQTSVTFDLAELPY